VIRKIVFEIGPKARFGLPHESRVVIPRADADEFQYPKHEPHTLIKIKSGTLSHFRHPTNAIDMSVTIDGVQLQLQDNIVFAEFDEQMIAGNAVASAFAAMDKLLRQVMLSVDEYFYWRALYWEGDDPAVGDATQFRRGHGPLLYDLACLKDALVAAPKDAHAEDSILRTALRYYEYALFFIEEFDKLSDLFPRRYEYLTAPIILNFWKALATIVGDKLKDSSSTCKRRRDLLQLGEEMENRIEKVNTMRNSYDVAHVEVEGNHDERARIDIAEARQVAELVLKAYRERLLAGKCSFTNI